MADTDPLVAALQRIGERCNAVFRGSGRPDLLLAIRFAEEDGPRLVAALDAVLKPHQPGRIVISGALCKVHENHRYFSITQAEADRVVACKDCPATVYTSCDGCDGGVPFGSCRVRARAARGLTGEKVPDERQARQ